MRAAGQQGLSTHRNNRVISSSAALSSRPTFSVRTSSSIRLHASRSALPSAAAALPNRGSRRPAQSRVYATAALTQALGTAVKAAKQAAKSPIFVAGGCCVWCALECQCEWQQSHSQSAPHAKKPKASLSAAEMCGAAPADRVDTHLATPVVCKCHLHNKLLWQLL